MECLFIRHMDPVRIAAVLEHYRLEGAADLVPFPKWPSVPLYPTNIKVSPLRKGLMAAPDFPPYWPSIMSDGGARLAFQWLLLVEEHDCIDLRLAAFLSREVQSIAFAAHASDWTDEYGYCTYRNGEMESEFFREMEERPVYRIDQELEARGIPYTICRYQECGGPGWLRVLLDP